MFSKKATKIDKIFTIDLTLGSKCQIIGEDFVKFCGLLRKREVYKHRIDRKKFYKGVLGNNKPIKPSKSRLLIDKIKPGKF